MSRNMDNECISAVLGERGEEAFDEFHLALLVHFSHPSEMRKAYDFLSGISCTIRPNPPVFADAFLKLSKSETKEFSVRECEILTLFAKGYSYSETAACLSCKISTIQTHVKHIYSKMGVHSRAEAIHEALQMMLIHI